MSSDSKPKRKRHWRLMNWLIGLVVVIGLVSPVVYTAFYRARCGSAMFLSSIWMTTIVKQSIESVEKEHDSIPSVALQLAEGRWESYFGGMCFSDSLNEVRMAGHSLRDIQRGKVSIEQVRRDMTSVLVADDWERVGRFQFSREAAAFENYNHKVIVGISCYETGGSALVSFSSIYAEAIYSRSELAEYIEWDRQERESLGLNPPINFEQIIDDYRVQKELEPLPD